MHDPLQVEFTQHDSHQDSLFHYNEVDMKESPTLQGIDSGGASSKDDPPVEPVSTAATLSVQPSNESIQQLAPFFELGTRIFLDICSGVSKPLSSALIQQGRTVLAIDILLHSSMNLLQDEFFEQLLRLCGTGLIAYCATAPNWIVLPEVSNSHLWGSPPHPPASCLHK